MSGSIPTFASGLAQGLIEGYDTVSTGKYRKSIMQMRQQQTKAAQAAAQQAADKTNAATLGALMAPNGRLAPGQDLSPQSGAASYIAGLPPSELAVAKANALAQGFTEPEWDAYVGSGVAPVAQSAPGGDPDPYGLLAQNSALPAMRAKGGAVPMGRYDFGGLVSTIGGLFNSGNAAPATGPDGSATAAAISDHQGAGPTDPALGAGLSQAGGSMGTAPLAAHQGAGPSDPASDNTPASSAGFMGTLLQALGMVGSSSNSAPQSPGTAGSPSGAPVQTFAGGLGTEISGGKSGGGGGGQIQTFGSGLAAGIGGSKGGKGGGGAASAVTDFAKLAALAKGGAIPMGHYAGGGEVDPAVTAAVSQSNGQPQGSPASTAAPSALPMPPSVAPPPSQTGAPAAAPPPPQAGAGAPPAAAIPAAAIPAAAIPAGVTPQSAQPQQPPVPPGGMPLQHPPGLTPPAGINDPKPELPGTVIATGTPASASQMHGTVAFHLHSSQVGQLPPAQAKANYTELQNGAGAISNAAAQALRVKVNGPQAARTDPLGIQNASMINNLYNYDMQHFGPQAAAADSFAVLQNFRVNMQMYGGAAVSAFQNGDLQTAAHYLEHAYAFFPDGNEVKVTPGANNSLVATRYDLNGKVIDTSNFATPQDLTQFAMASTNFDTYNSMLNQQQQLALKAADVHNEMNDRDAGVGLRAKEVNDEAENIHDQMNDRDRTTAYEVSGGASNKPPSAGEAATYDTAMGNALEGQLGQTLGYDKWAPQAQAAFQSGATSIGLSNGLPPSTAAAIARHIISNPKSWDAAKGTATIGGTVYKLGDMNTMMQNLYPSSTPTQSKATGGIVTPTARAVAALPTG